MFWFVLPIIISALLGAPRISEYTLSLASTTWHTISAPAIFFRLSISPPPKVHYFSGGCDTASLFGSESFCPASDHLTLSPTALDAFVTMSENTTRAMPVVFPYGTEMEIWEPAAKENTFGFDTSSFGFDAIVGLANSVAYICATICLVIFTGQLVYHTITQLFTWLFTQVFTPTLFGLITPWFIGIATWLTTRIFALSGQAHDYIIAWIAAKPKAFNHDQVRCKQCGKENRSVLERFTLEYASSKETSDRAVFLVLAIAVFNDKSRPYKTCNTTKRLKKENNRLQSMLNIAHATIRDQEGEINELEKKPSRHADEIEDLKSTVKSKQAEIHAYEVYCRELTNEKNEAEYQKERAQSSKPEVEVELADVKSKLRKSQDSLQKSKESDRVARASVKTQRERAGVAEQKVRDLQKLDSEKSEAAEKEINDLETLNSKNSKKLKAAGNKIKQLKSVGKGLDMTNEHAKNLKQSRIEGREEGRKESLTKAIGFLKVKNDEIAGLKQQLSVAKDTQVASPSTATKSLYSTLPPGKDHLFNAITTPIPSWEDGKSDDGFLSLAATTPIPSWENSASPQQARNSQQDATTESRPPAVNSDKGKQSVAFSLVHKAPNFSSSIVASPQGVQMGDEDGPAATSPRTNHFGQVQQPGALSTVEAPSAAFNFGSPPAQQLQQGQRDGSAVALPRPAAFGQEMPPATFSAVNKPPTPPPAASRPPQRIPTAMNGGLTVPVRSSVDSGQVASRGTLSSEPVTQDTSATQVTTAQDRSDGKIKCFIPECDKEFDVDLEMFAHCHAAHDKKSVEGCHCDKCEIDFNAPLVSFAPTKTETPAWMLPTEQSGVVTAASPASNPTLSSEDGSQAMNPSTAANLGTTPAAPTPNIPGRKILPTRKSRLTAVQSMQPPVISVAAPASTSTLPSGNNDNNNNSGASQLMTPSPQRVMPVNTFPPGSTRSPANNTLRPTSSSSSVLGKRGGGSTAPPPAPPPTLNDEEPEESEEE